MALAEVVSPSPESKGFRPQLVEIVPEETPVSHLTPPEDLDIFIDDGIANRMRMLILDDTIEIAASGRSCRENYGTWEEDDLVEYGQWLCRFLGIEPDGSGDSQFRQSHIVRASKLGVGPSYKVFKNVLGKKALLNLKQAMGEKAPRNMFTDKSEAWCVSQGILLADNLGRRPTAPLMDKANEDGQFPTSGYIKDHFRLTTFHELIGYPSLKGGDVVDFDKWGAAFKRQNGPETPLNFANVNELAKQGRGPWRPGVARVYPVDDVYDEFDRRATAEYWRQIAEDQALAANQVGMIDELRKEDGVFEEATDLIGGEELRRVWGGYRLVTQLIPDIDLTVAAEIAESCTPYELADWVSSYRPDMKLADIQTWAELLEVSNALWPYRFHNADLRVENAVGGDMPEIVPLPTPAQSESAAEPTQTRLAIRRQRRLARLAASGLGIEAPDAAYDVNRFAKHGGKFTPEEMHDLQNVVRRGERKAKRLELLGDELTPAERQQLNQIVRQGNDAKEAFVKANAGLVRYLLKPKFAPRRTTEQLDEILHAGEIGVIKALHKFDPDRGFKFGTYAEWWIKREAFVCARRQNYGLTLSQDDDSALRSALNIGTLDTDEPTDEELAFLERVKSVASLNKPGKADGAELGALLTDDFGAAPDEVATSRADAVRLFETLVDEDGLELRQIVSQRFGLADGIERKPGEIADEMGINGPAAAKRVKIALKRIREANGINV